MFLSDALSVFCRQICHTSILVVPIFAAENLHQIYVCIRNVYEPTWILYPDSYGTFECAVRTSTLVRAFLATCNNATPPLPFSFFRIDSAFAVFAASAPWRPSFATLSANFARVLATSAACHVSCAQAAALYPARPASSSAGASRRLRRLC